ncbi:MAG: M28 family peptidase [Candidatus Latescibacteria bacterium]|jgi:aminoglycoside N3'-acetyltransferase|nr:M28 family peptidase [Candidatus Latescibacterota bacterium]MBT5832881.1 M28 family peptidase [Candidatus Latescibacterota bacterium]
MSVRTPRSLAAFNRKTLPLIDKATQGRRILSDVKRIIETDRWNSFDKFHDTTDTLVKSYEASGAKAEVYKIPTGGKIGSGRWIIPKASDIRSATLDIVAPVRQKVLNYKDNPWHVIQWSASTPPKGIDCELVVIDDQKQLESLRPTALRNKMVLTNLNARNLFKTIADKGAVGLITDCPQKGLPNATPWVKFGWGSINSAFGNLHLVGLVLSQNDGQKLRKQIQKHGKLTVRVKVDIQDYVGSHDLVSGLVLGQDDPQEEVWALAHSAEPGAIDNASGVALCLEIARTLESLIASGKLPRPKRTIRLLSGYECYSFFNYMEHTRRPQTPIAGVCIDTVGARPDLCAGQLSWRSTIPMSATFVDRVGAHILNATLKKSDSGYTLKEGGFVSTSDTLAGDPKYGFPCPWITTHYREEGKNWNAYHSSNDVPALLSAKGLKACAVGMAAYLYYLADAADTDVRDLSSAETEYTCEQLRQTRSSQVASYLREQHNVSLTQLQRWLWNSNKEDALAHVAQLKQQVQETGPKAKKPSRVSHSAKRIPRRTAFLSPTPENTPPPIVQRIHKSGLPQWAHFWADGNRNLADITELLSAEHSKKIAIENVIEYFEAHEQLNYVQLIEPDQIIGKAQLIRDLKALGIQTGMDVMVHSALSKVGHVDGGANTVIDALLSIIGKRGTLVMPSFNHGWAHVFNPLTTPTTNGAIPDTFWRRTGVIRSQHASHAIAAFGPKAEAICADHNITGCWTADSPISRVIHNDGYILSIGVDHHNSTAYHAAEVSMPCGCIDPFGYPKKVLINGTVSDVPGLAFRNGPCLASPRKLNAALKNRQTHGNVGNADSTLVKAIDLWHARKRHLKDLCPTCPVKPRYPDE